jgi:probable F420-dependent oxidoreductase
MPALGLVLPPAVPPGVLWPAVEAADSSGFDSIWVTDRTIANTPWLDALTLLGAVAARTSRVRIGTSVLSVARRNPVLTAHALATAQFLSNGRVTAGIGLGGLEPAEFEIADVPLSRRGALTDESIGLLRRLWSEDNVDHHGGGYQYRGIHLAPRPASTIPIWIGGNSPQALARAGTLGDGWLSAFTGPDMFADGWSKVAAHAEAAGRDPDGLTAGAYAFAAIGRRSGEAERVLEPAVRSVFGVGLEQMSAACIYGTPEGWIDTLSGFAEAGAQHVNVLLFSSDLPHDVELIKDEVLSPVDPTDGAGRSAPTADVAPHLA